jgi:hypothetical protein
MEGGTRKKRQGLKRDLFIGDSIRVRGARSRALPLILNKVIHRLIHRLCKGWGVIHRGRKRHPRVLSLTAGTYILPKKKYTLK